MMYPRLSLAITLAATMSVAADGQDRPAPARSEPAHAAHAHRVAIAEPAAPIAINDNRTPAGQLRNGVLAIRLEARTGVWHPEGPKGMGLTTAAWAEEGKPLQNPGPLIRVPVGTQVHATVRNTLATPLVVYGFGAQRGLAGDTLVLAPGETREARFTATTPGTYYYAGKLTTTQGPIFARLTDDSQLNGVIMVDDPKAPRRADDRPFLISWWFTIDTTSISGLGRGTMVLNGLSWPHTERFDVTQGDSLHWRWINLTGDNHPMHLHGFYFRVTGKGDGVRDTLYAPAQQRLGVTEWVAPGQTASVSWSPTKPGNWIFHCHFAGHLSHLVQLDTERGIPAPQKAHEAHGSDAPHQMAGLVLGIRVRPKGAAAPATREARPLRLEIRSRPNVFGDKPGYSYALGGTPEASNPDAHVVPGPALVLERNQPVAVTIVNRSHEPAAVHWHGIELESYPDGVPGWSGEGSNVLPSIRPGDSLTVRFTPPRAGTFMYHSHFNEFQQIGSGLYGPIIVTEPGQRYDPEIDRVLLFSDGGPFDNVIMGPLPPVWLNGKAQPEPMELRAGQRYRLRLINIRTDFPVVVALRDASGPVQWRLVAKDGADVPAAHATTRPAQLAFVPGEIYDFEFTPSAAGDLTLEFARPPFPGEPPPPPTLMTVKVR